MSTQTVNVSLPAAAGDVPVSDGIGGFAGQPLVLASNAASGPAASTPIGAGTKVPWAALDVGGAGTIVPITPKLTGRVRVAFSITMLNTAATLAAISARILIGGVAQVAPFIATAVPGNGVGVFGIVSFEAEVTLPVGVTSSIEVDLTTVGASMTMYPSGSTLALQELPAATG
jgi:hypothetical protein